MNTRRGIVMVVVMGLMLMMVGLLLSLISSTRSDTEQLVLLRKQTQCRLLLAAACMYVQEGSRLGWDRHTDPQRHEETFGWVDVRDGSIGPRTWDFDGDGQGDARWSAAPSGERWSDGSARPTWPAPGSVVRCPMHRLQRPPWSIASVTSTNPMSQDLADPALGLPLLSHPDPLPNFGDPALDDLVLRRPAPVSSYALASDTAGTARLAAWQRGDPLPIPSTMGQAWFRIYRDGPATFVATVGAGGTQGFRSWQEVTEAGGTGMFAGDQSFFEELLRQEVRLWYRFEWSPAVSGLTPYFTNASYTNLEVYGWPEYGYRSGVNAATMAVNQGGTIQWIQRLRVPPEDGRW